MKKFFAFLLALSLFLAAAIPALAYDDVGSAASEMELIDVNGEPVTLSSFLGKPVVINFWAAWCPWCIYEFPAYEKLYQEYGDRVQFIMADLCDGSYETEETAMAYIAESGYTFPIFFDKKDQSYYNFGYTGIPASVFINADGVIVAAHVGAMDENSIRTALESILPAE